MIRMSLVAMVLVAITSPAAAQNREHQQIAADARMLQEQVQQLAVSVSALSQALAEAITALNTRLNDAVEATRQGFADQRLQTDNLGNDVRVIRERSSDTNVRIANLTEELEAIRGTVQALQQAVLTPPVPAVPADPNAPVPAAPVQPAPAPTLPANVGLSPQRMYDSANADYFAGQYASAISGFQALLMSFPRSEWADDAQLHIGDSYFLQNRWAEAIAAYNQVVQNYQGTNSVPEAYYKRGLAQERSGDIPAARTSWEALLKAFPDSSEAVLAKQNLERVSRAQRP